MDDKIIGRIGITSDTIHVDSEDDIIVVYLHQGSEIAKLANLKEHLENVFPKNKIIFTIGKDIEKIAVSNKEDLIKSLEETIAILKGSHTSE